MLNYIRADLYRILSRPLPWLWFLIAAGSPALAVLGMGKQYELAQVLLGVQVGIYIVFIFLSLILNEYTFREDMQLGMLKNDTTSGISRGKLFMAKYLTGVFMEAVLWVVCSVCAVIACGHIFGMAYILSYWKTLFSVQTVSWLFNNLLFLALFQVISIFVKKTSGLILVCLIVSTFVSRLGTLLGEALPGTEQAFTLLVTTGQPTVFQTVTALACPLAGAAALCLAGCALFRRSEF